MSEEGICKICEASFRPEAMVKEKCISCDSLYPKAQSREDIKINTKNKSETLTTDLVKDTIYEILEEANIVRHPCEKCKKLFFRRSPAQRQCKNCKDAK